MTNLDTIINLHEKLIYKISSRFHDIDKEDLYQSGVIGLIKAYHNYKSNEETKFTTYAYNYIFGEMYEFANNMRTIKVNKNILKLYKKIEQAKYHLAQKKGYYPSISEVSEFLNLEESILLQVEQATSTIMSLDSDKERPLHETIASPSSTIDSTSIDIQDSLQTLTPEEKDIINYRYFKDFTQSQTAQILGMSQVKVSRYEKKSLTKMYNYLSI